MQSRIEQLSKLLETDPNDAFCLYSIGFEHAKDGDFEQAISFYDRATEADADYCYAYYQKAKCLAELNRTPEALDVLTLGHQRAHLCGDTKAASEIAELADELR